MPRTYTIAEVRARGLLKADHANDTFCSTAECAEIISEAFGRYYELLLANPILGYVAESTTSWTSDGITGTQALDSTFYRLLAVEHQITSEFWVPIEPAHPRERTLYRTTDTLPWGYRMDGSNVILMPIPGSGKAFRVRYYAAPAKFTSSSDATTIEGYSGWEAYCASYLASYVKKKEEAKDPFEAEYLYMEERIKQEAANRIALTPGRTHDVNEGWPNNDIWWRQRHEW